MSSWIRFFTSTLTSPFRPASSQGICPHGPLQAPNAEREVGPGTPGVALSSRRVATFLSLSLAALPLLLAALPGEALALERSSYSMEILVDGRPVQEYCQAGTVYIEAIKGREYSIRLRNNTGERIAIALAVDGLNSIDAETTTAFDGSKWILEPWQTITLDGWQTSSSTARRFFFTTEMSSYGAWLGKTKNLGVISAAVFREKRPVPVPYCREGRPGGRPCRDKDGLLGRIMSAIPGLRNEPGEAQPPSPLAGAAEKGDETAAQQAMPSAGDSDDASRLRESSRKTERVARPSNEFAATGIGRELGHTVRRIDFDEETTPAAILEVRYEYRDALVRLGILPPLIERGDPLARRERAHGFEDTGFAPDPYRHSRR